MYNVKFFKDAERDMVEIGVVGDPNTVIRKAKAEDRTQFKAQWDAYEANTGAVEWGGTPLTELVADLDNGTKVAHGFATSLALKGVQNVEMLAALSDAAATSLGMGVVTLRTRAREYVAQQQAGAMDALVAAQKAKPKPEGMPTFDIADLEPIEDEGELEDLAPNFIDDEPAPRRRRKSAQ